FVCAPPQCSIISICGAPQRINRMIAAKSISHSDCCNAVTPCAIWAAFLSRPARRHPAWVVLTSHHSQESVRMSAFQDPAYTMAAMSATVALFRGLVKKGVLTRDEAVRVILDEAVARAIQAEADDQRAGGRSTNDLNRQTAEILKFIAEKL